MHALYGRKAQCWSSFLRLCLEKNSFTIPSTTEQDSLVRREFELRLKAKIFDHKVSNIATQLADFLKLKQSLSTQECSTSAKHCPSNPPKHKHPLASASKLPKSPPSNASKLPKSSPIEHHLTSASKLPKLTPTSVPPTNLASFASPFTTRRPTVVSEQHDSLPAISSAVKYKPIDDSKFTVWLYGNN